MEVLLWIGIPNLGKQFCLNANKFQIYLNMADTDVEFAYVDL